MTKLSIGERPRWALAGIRARILVGFVGMLALATIASVFVARQVLYNRLDERINRELLQETSELRSLAGGIDPATGEPFGDDVRRIFRVYFARNAPSRGEAVLTFVAGELFLRNRQVVPYRLDRDSERVAHWGALTRPELGEISTPAGPVDYRAVPLEVDGRVLGVFVVSIFRQFEQEAIDDAITATAAVGLAVLLIGSLLAWRVAESVLRPVRAVTDDARSITETDLSRRIEVQGQDEIGELASAFNATLDRLETAFRTQRSFLDDAGHELKTPLTIVRGHLELLGDDPSELRTALPLVLDELDRMNRIVNDLLLLAKAEAPNFLHLDTVDVAVLTAEVQTKAAALAPRAWTIDERGRGIVVADRQRLTEALMQLAENAVKHTEDGDEIGVGSAVADGEARFWIRDEGDGIPAHDRKLLFSRFARGSGASRKDGAGLGLSIVKAIADAHHGRVQVDSEPSEGSTFTLVLPVDQPSDEEHA